ncbi:MAG: hypothetical protein K1X79_10280 [Oligoflexia bacterium]|nr:hypothetical protein [Oligoflexia bacterium]
MVAVRINGEDAPFRTEGVLRISDIIELIKANIDPEHMITVILIDGHEFSDEDWTAPVSKYNTSILEVETGTPESFVNARLSQSSDVVRTCYLQFRDARKSFQDGDMSAGNKHLIEAVNTAKAFFEWYGTILELVPAERRAMYDISPQVTEISGICKTICQQQLYQSWWALGETIGKELEPRLDRLEDHLRKFQRASC